MEKITVIKVGGKVVDDEKTLKSFLQEFALIKGNKVLVHGGGKLATDLSNKLGIKPTMIEGRRVTEKDTLEIVTMVYAGLINKKIVATLQANNCNALGLCGADGNLILAHKREKNFIIDGKKVDFGFVGDVDEANADLMKALIENNLTLVIAPITHNAKGDLLNTNADTTAQAIAQALTKYFEVHLIFTFEKEGVLLDVNDDASSIKELNHEKYLTLIAKDENGKSKISDGMLPKLDNAFYALNNGVKKITIGKAEKLTQLINDEAGTLVRL